MVAVAVSEISAERPIETIKTVCVTMSCAGHLSLVADELRAADAPGSGQTPPAIAPSAGGVRARTGLRATQFACAGRFPWSSVRGRSPFDHAVTAGWVLEPIDADWA